MWKCSVIASDAESIPTCRNLLRGCHLGLLDEGIQNGTAGSDELREDMVIDHAQEI